MQPRFQYAAAWSELQLADLEQWQVALAAALVTLVLVWLWSLAAGVLADAQEIGFVQLLCNALKTLPLVRGWVRRQKLSTMKQIRASMQRKHDPNDIAVRQLPQQGLSAEAVRDRLKFKEAKDLQIVEGSSKVSGALYMAGSDHRQLLADAYTMYAHTNPIHSDVFPSVRQLEAEVIAMTAALLGGGPQGNPEVCGAMTSGGSESILTAVKASRDYMRAVRGIRKPEMVIGDSAHAAFFKAAEYFKIKLVKVPVGKDYRLSAATVKRAITANTILVVASSPGFPHGVIDHVADIAKVTRQRRVLLHVDACLGGFVLPFARKLGYPIPPFDFAVPGVTSMSVDTHKFGMAHKGTSVVLYHSKELRQFQYTSITEWTGGLYISPGFAGSRSGALIASAWAALVHQGEDGYLGTTKQLMDAAAQFAEGVSQTEGLELCGRPDMCVVAFKSNSKAINIYKVNDLMSGKGWHLNALMFPPAVHMCFTAQHTQIVGKLIQDLKDSVQQLRENPDSVQGGTAPIYGMAGVIPDRKAVGEILIATQDVLLE
jgi:sphinganine-1-phosphate aldolase